MSYDNHGTQSGDGSINVGVGDFRGANISIGGGKPAFSPQQLGITRHPIFGRLAIKNDSLGTFGIVTGVASVIGLYFTLFQVSPQATYSSWSTFFVFCFGLAATTFGTSFALKKRKFGHFLFRRYYLETGNSGGIHLSSFTATCPWCGSKMHLCNVGPQDGPRDDLFICDRNPKQHSILLDPTVLPEIDEEL